MKYKNYKLFIKLNFYEIFCKKKYEQKGLTFCNKEMQILKYYSKHMLP